LSKGFLGTAAPIYADLTLLLEMAMAVGLFVGAVLARLGRFRGARLVPVVDCPSQSGPDGLTMLPAFHRLVLPKLQGRLESPTTPWPQLHAGLGSVAEFGGLYILLAAGTNLLPEKFRIKHYKFWMRSVLLVWWIVLLLGMAHMRVGT